VSGERDLPITGFVLRSAWVWLPLLVVAAAFAVVLAGDANRAAFSALNALGPRTSDALWANLTVLGDTVVALALCLPLWRRRADLVWALAIGGLLTTAWVHALKPIVKQPRPPAVLGSDVHVIGPAYRKQSFPSGHSTTIFAVAGLIALGLAPRGAVPAGGGRSSTAAREAPPVSRAALAHAAGAAAIGVASLAAMSRSVVGVHWPLDLLAGAFGGWLAAAVGLALARRTLAFGTQRAVQWILGLLLAGCAAALAIGYDSGYPQAEALQRILGVACLGCAAIALCRPRLGAGS
jgi:membrane-associated phospholipid phosphatase